MVQAQPEMDRIGNGLIGNEGLPKKTSLSLSAVLGRVILMLAEKIIMKRIMMKMISLVELRLATCSFLSFLTRMGPELLRNVVMMRMMQARR